MAVRKIELMHRVFGELPDYRCKDCFHLSRGRYHDKMLTKCAVYGWTHSAASDWAQSYIACGQYNKPYQGGPIICMVVPDRGAASKDNTPLEGQTSIFDEIE